MRMVFPFIGPLFPLAGRFASPGISYAVFFLRNKTGVVFVAGLCLVRALPNLCFRPLQRVEEIARQDQRPRADAVQTQRLSKAWAFQCFELVWVSEPERVHSHQRQGILLRCEQVDSGE